MGIPRPCEGPRAVPDKRSLTYLHDRRSARDQRCPAAVRRHQCLRRPRYRRARGDTRSGAGARSPSSSSPPLRHLPAARGCKSGAGFPRPRPSATSNSSLIPTSASIEWDHGNNRDRALCGIVDVQRQQRDDQADAAPIGHNAILWPGVLDIFPIARPGIFSRAASQRRQHHGERRTSMKQFLVVATAAGVAILSSCASAPQTAWGKANVSKVDFGTDIGMCTGLAAMRNGGNQANTAGSTPSRTPPPVRRTRAARAGRLRMRREGPSTSSSPGSIGANLPSGSGMYQSNTPRDVGATRGQSAAGGSHGRRRARAVLSRLPGRQEHRVHAHARAAEASAHLKPGSSTTNTCTRWSRSGGHN